MVYKEATLFQKIKLTVCGGGWVAGLLLAGSENPLMPWVNLVGLVLFFAATAVLGKGLKKIGHRRYRVIITEEKKMKTASTRGMRNRRVYIRYA